MIKKTIISILVISLIGGVIYFNKENPPKQTKQQEVSAPQETIIPKKFIDESKLPPSKTDEERILVKRDYEKGLEFIKNRELEKEEERKEKLQQVIKYIRDLGFEVDEEKEIVQVLKYIEGSERTTSIRYLYSYNVLNFKTLLELNKYSNKIYELKIPNPMGPDFIIDYDNLKEMDTVRSLAGAPSKVYLSNTKGISSTYRWLNYYEGTFKFKFVTGNNEYFADGLKFEYEGIRKDNGIVYLSVDLDPNTGKKRYVEFIID